MAKRRVALLIATDTYADEHFTNLRTPGTDARALAALLGDPKIGAFTVRTLTNRPAQEVRDVLDDTFGEPERDDLVLLHLSGHGLKDESGKLHLIMSDTRHRALRSSAIAASWVRELIDHSAARRVVVWLDCCFSGAFPPGFTPKGDETVDAVDQLAGDSGRGCAVMTASTKVQYAFEKEQSIFTEAIMSGLRTGAADLDEDGLVDASELYSYVHDWVRARTPGQTPTRNDMLAGDIYIAYNHNTLQLPLELPHELRVWLRSSDPKYRSIAIRELSTLAKSGDETAHLALAALGEEPQEPVEVAPPPPVVVKRPTMVVDVPKQSLVARLIQEPSQAGFTFSHEIYVSSTATRARIEISDVAFDPTRPFDLCGVMRGELRWFHARTGVIGPPSPRPDFPHVVEVVAFSADQELLAIGGFSGVTVFGRRQHDSRNLLDGWVRRLAFSPDNDTLASVDHDFRISLRHRHDGRLIRELQGRTLMSVAFSPDGRVLAGGGAETVTLWEVSSGKLLHTLHHPDAVRAITFSPDGRLLVTGDGVGVLRSGAPNSTWHPMELRRRHNAHVVSVTFNAEGTLVTAAADGHLMFWEPS